MASVFKYHHLASITLGPSLIPWVVMSPVLQLSLLSVLVYGGEILNFLVMQFSFYHHIPDGPGK